MKSFTATPGRRVFSILYPGLLLVMILFVLMVITPGCSSKKSSTKSGGATTPPSPEIPPTAKPGGPPEWGFGSNAVVFSIKADNMLNLFDNNAHTLVICVYQFADPNAFNDLAKDETGVVKMLGCTKFNDAVSSVQRIIIQPGELRNVFLDRAEGAKYVALVAGFFDLNPKKATLLLQIPIEEVKKGLLFKTKYQLPGLLYTQLYLGPTEMQVASGLVTPTVGTKQGPQQPQSTPQADQTATPPAQSSTSQSMVEQTGKQIVEDAAKDIIKKKVE